jgi:hypothetical protein
MESDRQAKPPSRVSIERVKNGAFVVNHSFDNMGSGESYRQNEVHAFTNHKQMIAHVSKHTGGKEPDADDAKPPTGVSGHATAAPPTARSRGAGMD